MQDYYRKRAQEYEEIYNRPDPDRQMEQSHVKKMMQEALRGKHVLEIACGTGYWTEFLSETAEEILATDAVQEVMDIARSKKYQCHINFEIADAYKLFYPDSLFDGGMANLWFSHIPKNRMAEFLDGFHRVLKFGAHIFFADNVYVPGIGGKLIKKNGDDDTYKLRKLKDGSENLILKNYYSPKELIKILKPYAKNITEKNIFYGKSFWCVSYQKA